MFTILIYKDFLYIICKHDTLKKVGSIQLFQTANPIGDSRKTVFTLGEQEGNVKMWHILLHIAYPAINFFAKKCP